MSFSGDFHDLNTDDFVPDDFVIKPIYVVVELFDPPTDEMYESSNMENSSFEEPKKEVKVPVVSNDLNLYMDQPGDGSAFLPGCLSDDTTFFSDELTIDDADFGLTSDFIADYSRSTNYDGLFAGNAVGSNFM
uniref:Uncharacterized protein n=1 Tax=Panagrolaimus sp. JU765 TaxID=591449 RepID=A0AC34QGG5_9BILA